VGEGEKMKTTIDMAREVKATAYTSRHYPDRTTYTFGPEQLKAFEALVRADEREACAKVCDEVNREYDGEEVSASWVATAIRNRGDT
jgi:hypothetical protein